MKNLCEISFTGLAYLFDNFKFYSPTDVSAAQNIGRLIARRCAMAGIKYLTSGITEEELEGSKRVKKLFFIKNVI